MSVLTTWVLLTLNVLYAVQWHIGVDDFAPVDESVMGIGKVFTETSHIAIYG